MRSVGEREEKSNAALDPVLGRHIRGHLERHHKVGLRQACAESEELAASVTEAVARWHTLRNDCGEARNWHRLGRGLPGIA
eukprot:3933935-Rhodomonas_salina.7